VKSTHLRHARMPSLRRTIASIALLAAAAGACGLPSVPPRATTAPDPAVPHTSTAPSPRIVRPSAPFASPIDRLIYDAAFDRCSIGGADGVAGDFGGNASDPTTVAEAYAEFASPDRTEPAYQGCLDGLHAANP